MKRLLFAAVPVAGLALALCGHAAPPNSSDKKFEDFEKVVKGEVDRWRPIVAKYKVSAE